MRWSKSGIGERPVFLLASLSITVLLGTKIGRPPMPSKFQFPQHRCLYQFSELGFLKLNIVGDMMELSLRLVQLLEKVLGKKMHIVANWVK